MKMVKRSRGSLSKSTKQSKKTRKLTVSDISRKFKLGDKVLLRPTHVVEGRPPARYRGKHGEIVEVRGNSYIVEIKDGGKKKRFITSSVHIAQSG
jgi:large subunit ribosomal protein L21e